MVHVEFVLEGKKTKKKKRKKQMLILQISKWIFAVAVLMIYGVKAFATNFEQGRREAVEMSREIMMWNFMNFRNEFEWNSKILTILGRFVKTFYFFLTIF